MEGSLFITGDGSHSIQSKEFGVSYHSSHGAIQETQHIFIESALLFKASASHSLSILEIGFGTGLNALMSFLTSQQQQLNINYTTVEAYPIAIEQARQLNYCQLLDASGSEDVFLRMHQAEWESPQPLSSHFTFTKTQQRIEELAYSNQFDIIYFDAFAPEAQPELWEAAVLQKMYDALRPEGVMTTYCAKGVVKRTLRSIGFELQSLPGPPGKREISRAIRRG